MVNFDELEELLYTISRAQIERFFTQVQAEEIYGFGYFCDAYEGVMLVANTLSYHEKSWKEYATKWVKGTFREEIVELWGSDEKFLIIEDCGMDQEDLFKWNIGNWQSPAGLEPSSSPGQMEFAESWATYSRVFRAELEAGDEDQEWLTEVWDPTEEELLNRCVTVLERLKDDGVFDPAENLEGFIVLGPNDTEDVIALRKVYLDEVLMGKYR